MENNKKRIEDFLLLSNNVVNYLIEWGYQEKISFREDNFYKPAIERNIPIGSILDIQPLYEEYTENIIIDIRCKFTYNNNNYVCFVQINEMLSLFRNTEEIKKCILEQLFTINERISNDAQLRIYENIKKALNHDKILILAGGLEFSRVVK